MALIPLFGRGFTSKSPTVTSQLLVNMYWEPEADEDKTAMALYGTPGLAAFVTFSAGGGIADLTCRAKRQVGSYLWDIIGNSAGGSTAYYTNSAGIKTAIAFGTAMTTNQGRVGISDNGAQVIIVDGVGGWTCAIDVNGAPTAGWVKIASVNFPNGATTVTFLNGYFIVDNPSAGATHVGQFNWCAAYDGNTWAALDFANAESSPDPLIHVFANFGQLFLFGTTTTEVWAPSGDTAIFRRVGGAGVEWGLAAKWTVDKYANNSLIFLGKNKLGQSQLVRMDGYTVTPLTDPDVTHDINTRNVSAATGYTYSLDAHSFYQLNFPDKSYLYDDLSQSYSQIISNGGRHFGEIRAEMNAVSYVSDYANSNTYTVSTTTYSDNGYPIIRELDSRHVFHDLDFITIWELVLDMETGVGLVSGQGSDPQIMLQVSKDNGRTWGNERWRTIGAIGKYLTRIVWRQLGVGRDFVFKLRISDPIKVVFSCAAVRIS